MHAGKRKFLSNVDPVREKCEAKRGEAMAPCQIKIPWRNMSPRQFVSRLNFAFLSTKNKLKVIAIFLLHEKPSSIIMLLNQFVRCRKRI